MLFSNSYPIVKMKNSLVKTLQKKRMQRHEAYAPSNLPGIRLIISIIAANIAICAILYALYLIYK